MTVPAFIEEAPPVSEDRLEAIREHVRRARDLALEIDDLTERLDHLQKEQNKLLRETIPDKLSEVGLDSIGLEREGNLPPCDVKVKPFYSAGIPKKWDDERRKNAFRLLDEYGAGDLIKTEVAVDFPRDQRTRVEAFLEMIDGYDSEVREAVHHATLTAWVKDQVEAEHPLPPLEEIGAFVGRTAEIKKRRDR